VAKATSLIDSTGRFGCFPRQRWASQYETDNNGACLSIARPPAYSARGGVTRGRQMAVHAVRQSFGRAPSSLGGRKHPDCRDGSPLRGGRRNGDLGRHGTRKAHPASGQRPMPTTKGCSTRYGGGEPMPRSWRLAAKTGLGSFAPGGSAHAYTSLRSSVLGATDDGLAVPPRTRCREDS